MRNLRGRAVTAGGQQCDTLGGGRRHSGTEGSGGSRSENRALFAGHFLLGRMTATELDQLLSFARRRRYRASEAVFRKGDPGDSLIGIVHGHIKISTLSERGKEMILNILSPGDVFGEIALIDGRARTADATAM